MTKKKKIFPEERLQRVVNRLIRKFRPDQIQHALGNVYEEYSVGSLTEAEVDFWLKCARASRNLSSGMDKWLYEMVEEMEEEEEDESEG